MTDSGLGGLSVCAAVEARLRRQPINHDIELLFINAALRDDYGYNSMPTRQEKVETFDRFLGDVAERLRPDLLYIACNSLSVLLHDCNSPRHRDLPIVGIVDAGTQAMLAELTRDPQTAVIIFATPTTIEASTYRTNSIAAGIAPSRIAQQACPGLANAISDDITGKGAQRLLREFAASAVAKFDTPPSRVMAFLGCTHYGYRADLFEQALKQHVAEVSVLDPNAHAADEIITNLASRTEDSGQGTGQLTARFLTPYTIPPGPLTALPHFLADTAPATRSALQNFVVDKDLYPQG
ncbi:MAG: aspartate/glutamate racemase family protein [Planctomycetota bacterium]